MTSINVGDSPPFSHFALMLPLADRVALAELTTPAEVCAWTTAKAAEYRSFALALLAIGNTVAPIHGLPNETLSNIFAHSWQDRSSLRLAHVCRRWRSVVLSTPELWVNAARGDELPMTARLPRDMRGYMMAVLERTGNRPIEPSFNGFDSSLTELLGPHLWRMRSLTIGGLHKMLEVFKFLQVLDNGMPALEELLVRYEPERCNCEVNRCRGSGEGYISPPMHPVLRRASIPRLRHVQVPAFALQYVTGPSLEHVHVLRDASRVYHDDPAIDLGTLFALLDSCPRIVSLKLPRVLLPPVPLVFERLTPVTLPALNTLWIHEESASMTQLLRYLRCSPNYIHICEYGHSNYTLHGDWLKQGIADAVLSTADRVKIVSLAFSTFVRCFVQGEERLFYQSGRTLPGLVGTFHHSPVTALDLHARTFAPGECRSLLRDLAHLTRLAIRGGSAWKVLDDLLPLEDQHGQHEVAGRHLKRLLLDFHSDGRVAWHTWDSERIISPSVLADFHARCSQVETRLAALASHGIRLTHLEIYETKVQPYYFDPSSSRPVTILDMTSEHWNAVEPSLERLRRWVDGPVVFKGFRLEPCDSIDKETHTTDHDMIVLS